MTIKSVVLIRHAESLEDVDPTLHNISDDGSVILTERGKSQARKIGEILREELSFSKGVRVYLSLSCRVQETWKILSEAMDWQLVPVVDQRIKNLNWGDITLETRAGIEAERYRAGVLYYRFPGGDNTPDYVSGIGAFVSEMLSEKEEESYPEHILVITHGFALRVIAKFLLSISDDEFRGLRNPPNGYVLRIERKNGIFIPVTPLLRVANNRSI